ncbi:hypothetical protein PV325_003890 [Microctonus aethiopoides]|nr:hypothetical protein PV325_003890 [Microctonus aethiopoides]KAK0088083.1 hypothetical protein PV326_004946 [Microctonus aethiopoides]
MPIDLPRYLENRQAILRENHVLPTAGHLGIVKTIARVSARCIRILRNTSGHAKIANGLSLHRRNQQDRRNGIRKGEKVIKHEHTLSSAIDYVNAKLAAKYSEPLTVTKIVDRVIVEVARPQGKAYRVHVKNLWGISNSRNIRRLTEEAT